MTKTTFSPFDLAPGKLVAGRFRIERSNRHGGIAATFVATDEKSGEACELVVFPSSLFEEKGQAEQYLRALEPWREVRSPHVAEVRELLLLDGAALLEVCELPPGRSLRDWIKDRRRVEPEHAARLGAQLLLGVSAIHEHNLVHGDIKPQTIIVAEDGTGDGPEGELRGKLVDGGITTGLWSAKQLGDRTALIGTPFYAPVEQFGGESPDVQSDVYNVATVLFELVTGVLPWPGKSLLEVFQKKLERQPPSMRVRAPEVEVDPALERAITRGLCADRGERYHSASAFLAALEPFALR